MKLRTCMPRLLLLLAVFSALSCTAQTNSGTATYVFRNVNVIPMDHETVIAAQDVMISNGIIRSISATGTTNIPAGATVIDGSGKFLMPGLAEMHAHVPPVDDIEPMKKVLTLFLANGVTTIRGMLGHPKHLELRRMINSGAITGPHFITSGPSLNGNTVTSPQEAAAKVRQQKADGYDFLKLHPGLTLDNFNAIVQTAKAVQIPFAGHVSYDVGVWRAIDAGYASIDHMDGFVESLIPNLQQMEETDLGLFAMHAGYGADTTKIPALVNALKAQHIWTVPTQCLAERWMAPGKDALALSNEPEMKYMDAAVVEKWINDKNNLRKHPKYDSLHVEQFLQLRRILIAACNTGGAGLLLGSDAPQVFDVPGFSIHHELQYLVDAGLTPYQALSTGTANVAAFFNRSDMGKVQAGAVADLILLHKNPLSDIRNSTTITGVMIGGKWLSREWIDAALKKLERK